MEDDVGGVPTRQIVLERATGLKVNGSVISPYRVCNAGAGRWGMRMSTGWKAERVLLGLLLATGPIACAKPHQYIDVTCAKMAGETVLDREAAIQCQTFRQAEAATAVYTEASLLVKSYRACLEKYEQIPARAKEYCAQYPKALQEIGLQIKEQPDQPPRNVEPAVPPSKPRQRPSY